MTTRKNLFAKVVENNNDNVQVQNVSTTAENTMEPKPFIFFNTLSRQINDDAATIIKSLMTEGDALQYIHDPISETEINLADPHAYDNMLHQNAVAVASNTGMSVDEAFAKVKNNIENRHMLFNDGEEEDVNSEFFIGTPVTIDNFNDMMKPFIENIANDEKIKFSTVQHLIVDTVNRKIKSYSKNAYISFITLYNQEVSVAIKHYVDNSVKPVTVFPDLVTIDEQSLLRIDNVISHDIQSLFTHILSTQTEETLEKNLPMYYTNAEAGICSILMHIYSMIEDIVLKNFANYVNRHIGEIDMTVAHDLQLILIDKLPVSILTFKQHLYMLFNFIMTDITSYWLPMIEAKDKQRKEIDAQDVTNRGERTYGYYYSNGNEWEPF